MFLFYEILSHYTAIMQLVIYFVKTKKITVKEWQY